MRFNTMTTKCGQNIRGYEISKTNLYYQYEIQFNRNGPVVFSKTFPDEPLFSSTFQLCTNMVNIEKFLSIAYGTTDDNINN